MMTAASDTGSGVARSLVPARMDRNKTSYSPGLQPFGTTASAAA